MSRYYNNIEILKDHYNIDGKNYTRVSEVLSVINKPYLNTWRINKGKKKSAKIVKEAQDIGKEIHKAIECLIKNEVYKFPDDPYQEGIIKDAVKDYKKWAKENRFQPLESEIIVYSNQYKYGGKADIVGLIDNSLVIPDIKTGNRIYPEHKIQLGAYAHAYWELTGNEIEKLFILKLSKKKEYESKFIEIEETPAELFHTFLYALYLWRFVNGKKWEHNDLIEDEITNVDLWKQREAWGTTE